MASPRWETGECLSSTIEDHVPSQKSRVLLRWKKGRWVWENRLLLIPARLEQHVCMGFLAIFIASPKNYLPDSFSMALIIPSLCFVMLLMGPHDFPKQSVTTMLGSTGLYQNQMAGQVLGPAGSAAAPHAPSGAAQCRRACIRVPWSAEYSETQAHGNTGSQPLWSDQDPQARRMTPEVQVGPKSLHCHSLYLHHLEQHKHGRSLFHSAAPSTS